MKKFSVTYKGRGPGFAKAWMIVEANTKKGAKEAVWAVVNIPIVFLEVKPLLGGK